MEKLQLPHAKLLYYVSELFKQKEITNQEKLQLKEMIISDEPIIFKYIDTYQTNQNIAELKNGLLSLIRPEMEQQQLYQLVNTQENNQIVQEPTNQPENQKEKEQEEEEGQFSEYSDENQIEEQARIEDPTSPLGNQLFKKKRQRPVQKQHNKGILQPIMDPNSPNTSIKK